MLAARNFGYWVNTIMNPVTKIPLTGVAQFDCDHAKMISTLDEMLCSFDRSAHIPILLEKVIGEWIIHMTEEEAFMFRHKMPMLEEHSRDHSQFLDLLKRIRWALRDNTLSIDFALINNLKHFALEHIENADVQYGMYYNAQQQQEKDQMPS